MNTADRIDLFKNMAESDPDNELAHFSLGKLYVESGEFAQAESSLRRCLEINAEHSVAHELLGQALLKQEKQDEAVALLQSGIELAHRRGEFMPRDRMRGILESIGVTPPDLRQAATAESDKPVDPNAWTCKRCFGANPQMDEAPFSSELGDKIHENICTSCWSEWMAMSIKVINEFRLNLATPEANEIYDQQMREFLGV